MAIKPSLLPFIQEVFGVKRPFTEFVKRNKLLSFAILLNLFFFTATMFSMEQNIRKEREVIDLRRLLTTQTKPIPQLNSNCETEVLTLEEDYRRINKLYGECMHNLDNKPEPIPRPTRNKEPVIIQRYSADDSLKRKLDEIR